MIGNRPPGGMFPRFQWNPTGRECRIIYLEV